MVTAGTYNIRAVYGGDANNLGSTSAAIVLTVNAAVEANADIPTLPEWAAMIFAMLLMWTLWRTDARGRK